MGDLHLIDGHEYSYIAIDSEIIRRCTDHEIWQVVAGAESALRALVVSGTHAADHLLMDGCFASYRWTIFLQ